MQQWKCSVCYMPSSEWDTFALAKCRGSLAERWALAEVAAAEAVGEVGPGHHRMLAGELVWCLRCGCYGEKRGKGLALACRGTPTNNKGGGVAAQLRSLMAGKHPKSGDDMPPSVDERGYLHKPTAAPSRAVKGSQRDQEAIQHMQAMRELDGPRRSSISSTPGRSSGEKKQDMLEKVRARERAAKAALAPPAQRVVRRLVGKQWTTQWSVADIGSTLQSVPQVTVPLCPTGNQLS